VDTLERLGLTRVGLLQNRVEAAYLEATNLVDEINFRMKQVKRQIWNREESAIWDLRRSDYRSNLWDDLVEAFSRGFKVTSIYMTSTWDTRSISLIALVLLIVWCWINLRKIRRRPDLETSLAPVHFLTNNIFISCLVLVVTFGAFLESNIPMSYLHLTGLLHLVGISILLRRYLTKTGKELGIWVIILWLGYSLDDLLGETTYGERWLLLAGGVIGIVLCLRLLKYRDSLVVGITFPPVLKPLVSLTLLMSVLSLVFDITGRTTLAKLLGVSGIHSLVYAVTLWVSSTIVLEVIYLQSEAYKESRFSAFLNFSELQHRFQYFLRLLSGLFWFILLTRNLSVFEPVYNMVSIIINKPRTLGSISFSLGSVFVFVLILWVSSILAQFVNFLFGQESKEGQSKRRNVAAIALMGRLGILTIGFLIAVGAAGIPLEKISFIIGALGVGIGFGMQTIVNNLVSGIILAFERPIQVGDQVEVAGKSGIVKEIGIRASKISNGEGADIIIPNGDLLSQTLTNWTLSNRNRRVGLNVRTTRDVDLGRVTDLIKGVLASHTDIMVNPGPSVQIVGFGGSWVEFQILFWSEDLENTGGLTHVIITELSAMFAKAKIDLANPGHDIYIRSEPDGSRLDAGPKPSMADSALPDGPYPPPAGPVAS
jgi:potassium efflux system protein